MATKTTSVPTAALASTGVIAIAVATTVPLVPLLPLAWPVLPLLPVEAPLLRPVEPLPALVVLEPEPAGAWKQPAETKPTANSTSARRDEAIIR